MDEILRAIYYDPKTGHTGAQQLYLRAKKVGDAAGIKITLAKVQTWLKEQTIDQSHAHNAMDRPANRFKITDVPNSYAVDSIFHETFKQRNKGYRGFLLFIELTTRKAYAYPFKTGSEQSPPTAQESLTIFKRFDAERSAEKHPVARISGDQGTELTNKPVQDFLHAQFIQSYFHRPEDHRANGLLNSAVRYIRRIIDRVVVSSESIEWLSKLDDAVANWNSHVISTVKASPDELGDDKEKRQEVRTQALEHNQKVWAKTALVDNDVVKRYLRRSTKGKGKFSKEGANWEGAYKITGRSGWHFDVAGLPHGYRPYELKKVTGSGTAPQTEPRGEEHPKDVAVKEARVKRRVRQALGKGAEQAIVREKRAVVTATPYEAPVAEKRAKLPPKARRKAGQIVREVEKVLQHRIVRGALQFKVKWRHLSTAESLALDWQPLSDFVEVVNGVDYYHPAIDAYMTVHGL